MKTYVVGCGLSGAVIARKLADSGIDVTIIDRRDHIAGNLADYRDQYGILVQKYGPHIFHTNNEDVMDFVRKFEEWKEYKLECGAVWDGKYTPSPFNFTTIDTFFDREKASVLKEKLISTYGEEATAPVLDLLESKDDIIREYAEFLFKNDYAPYTAKQWGMDPSEIDSSVLKRVPLRFSYHNSYFDDRYQALPKHSFSDFIKNMIDSDKIEVRLNEDAIDKITFTGYKATYGGEDNIYLVFTGAIDELFGYEFGQLPYRSLRFEWRHEDVDEIQKAAVVAYPKEKGFTRITEYKKLPFQNVKGTTYAIEYPLMYKEGKKMEPYYPIPTSSNEKKYNEYKKKANEIDNLVLCGRLADYKYYNMDQAIEHALHVAEQLINKINQHQ